MDGKGRFMDNIFIERLWRILKYEEIYLKDYDSVAEAQSGIGAWLAFYNGEHPHQALGYRTPSEVLGGEWEPVDLMDNAGPLPTTPQARQQQKANDSMEEIKMIPSL